MADRVELGYKITVQGAQELQGVAQSQKAVRQSARETNDVLQEQDKAFQRSSVSADAYARKMDALRRASFKRGETYDPELAEEARIKSLAQAHSQLDSQIEKAQLSQLRGLERINAERQKGLKQAAGYDDPALSQKFEQLASIKLQAFQKAEREAGLLATNKALQKSGTSIDTAARAAEETRINNVARAGARLDAQIQKGQLSQLDGYARLRAERDLQIRDLGALGDSKLLAKVDQAFVQRVNVLRDAQTAARAKAAESAIAPEFSIGAGQVAQLARNPTLAAGGIAEGAAESIGAVGTAVLGIVAALAAASAAGVALVHESAEWAQNTQNTAIRLGLTSTEMVKLGAAAKIAGVNITALEQAGRVLSQALEDPNGQGKKVIGELNKIGVKPNQLFDETGKAREIGPILLSALDALSKVGDVTERVAAGSRIFTRGFKEIAPAVVDLQRLKGIVDSLRIGDEGGLVPGLSEDARRFNELALAFERLKLILASKIAPIVIPIITTLTQAANNVTPLGALGVIGAGFVGGPVAAFHALRFNNALAEKNKEDQKPDLQVGAGREFIPDQDARDKAAADFKARFGRTEEGLELRKTAVQKDIGELSSKLSTGALSPENEAAGEKKLGSLRAEHAAIEASLKALHKDTAEYDKVKQEVAAYQKQAAQFDLTGIEKIQLKYRELVAEINKGAAKKLPGFTKGNVAGLLSDAGSAEQQELAQDRNKQAAARIREQIGLTEQLIALQARPGDELHTIQSKFRASNANVAAQFATGGLSSDERDKELAKAIEQRDKSLIEFYGRQIQEARQQSATIAGIGVTSRESQFEKQRAFNPFGVFNQADEEARARDISASRQGEIGQQQTIQAGVVGPAKARDEAAVKSTQEDARLQEQLLDIRLRGEQQILQIRRDQIATSTNEQVRLAQVTGNPEDQVANIQSLHDIKMAGLQEELALTGDIKAFTKAADAEEFDRVEKLLQLRQQEAEKFKSTITEGILALQNGGRDGLAKFAQNFAKGIESKVIGNAAGIGFNILQPLLPQIGGQHEVGPDGKPVTKNGVPQLTFLGQLLKGTPFGEKSDPVKLATDLNTTETKINTKAIEDLTAKLLAKSGPGSIPGAAAAAAVQAASAAKESCGCGGSGGGASIGGFGGIFPHGGTSVDSSIFYGSDGLPLPGTGPLNPDLFPNATSDEDSTDSGGGGASSDLSGLAAPGSGPLNLSTLPSVSAIPSALQSTFKAAGAAGAIAGGIFGVVSGIEKGGVRGDVSAVGSGLGAAAGVAALIPGGQLVAGALALGSLVTKLIGSFLPDARADRAKQEQEELQADRYVKPNSINVTETTAGNAAFTNANGGLNVLKGAPLVQLYNQILGIDPLNPNHLLSATNQQLSTATQALPSDLNPNISKPVSSSSTSAGPGNVTVQVIAMDSKSFLDNSGNIADAVSKAMRDGHRIGSDIVKRVRPQ